VPRNPQRSSRFARSKNKYIHTLGSVPYARLLVSPLYIKCLWMCIYVLYIYANKVYISLCLWRTFSVPLKTQRSNRLVRSKHNVHSFVHMHLDIICIYIQDIYIYAFPTFSVPLNRQRSNRFAKSKPCLTIYVRMHLAIICMDVYIYRVYVYMQSTFSVSLKPQRSSRLARSKQNVQGFVYINLNSLCMCTRLTRYIYKHCIGLTRYIYICIPYLFSVAQAAAF